MRHITYYPTGTCSQQIDITLDDNDIVQDVFFLGGCSGNLQGIGRLVRGMHREEVIRRLQGIRCGYKNTSCPDQLARALQQESEAL